MSILPDRSGCEGNNGISGQASSFEGPVGWDTNLNDFDKSKDLEYKLIKLANSKVSLKSLFKRYSVSLEATYSATGWSFRGSCPFDDHHDRTPSFGYNANEGLFNCFGCHRSGQAVEFMAAMEGKSRLAVARNLVGSISNNEIENFNLESFDYVRLESVLFDYADFVREFRVAHIDNEKVSDYIKAVTWNLDVYLRQHAPFNTISIDDLEVRISKLKDQINAYQDTI